MDIHIHIGRLVIQTPSPDLSEIEETLAQIGATLSELSDAVTALQGRITEDVQHLQDVIADLTGQLTEALGNDAADAATIAEKQAQLDAVTADVADTVARIQSIDPVADFPEPPVDQ